MCLYYYRCSFKINLLPPPKKTLSEQFLLALGPMNAFANYHNHIDEHALIIVYFSLLASGSFLLSRR